MPKLDSTAAAATAGHIAVAWFVWLDVIGDPIRVTNFGQNVPFTGTGDSDLDGNTFTAFGGEFMDIGDVANSESGSDTVTATLSGILSLDAALLAAIGDVTKWQGRTCRIWFRIYDPTGVTPQGAIVPFYTGYASSVSIMPGATEQTISLAIENYLAAMNQPSNRSYMNQSTYDPADTSAAATLAAANGSMRGGVGVQASSTGGSSSTGSGGANVGSFGGAYGSGTYDNIGDTVAVRRA